VASRKHVGLPEQHCTGSRGLFDGVLARQVEVSRAPHNKPGRFGSSDSFVHATKLLHVGGGGGGGGETCHSDDARVAASRSRETRRPWSSETVRTRRDSHRRPPGGDTTHPGGKRSCDDGSQSCKNLRSIQPFERKRTVHDRHPHQKACSRLVPAKSSPRRCRPSAPIAKNSNRDETR
jgi:hypothetical protein